jgi:hypothetical protein
MRGQVPRWQAVKRFLLLLTVCAALFSQIIPKNVTLITGDAAIHAIAANGGALWVTFTTPSGNSSHVFIGGSTVSSTNYVFDMAPGTIQTLPAVNRQPPGFYPLAQWYYLVANSDHLGIGWGQ